MIHATKLEVDLNISMETSLPKGGPAFDSNVSINIQAFATLLPLDHFLD